MHKEKFQWLMVTLASVEDIERWSNKFWLTNPDTLNYRTGKPKPKMIVLWSYFGPVKIQMCLWKIQMSKDIKVSSVKDVVLK